jgi:hypothetical protein
MSSFEEREQLAEAIGRDTLEAWQTFGARCLEELSQEDPGEFLRFCLAVLPDQVELDLDKGAISA